MPEKDDSNQELTQTTDQVSRGNTAAALWVRGASLEDLVDLMGFKDVNAARRAAEAALANSLTVPEKQAAMSLVWQRYEKLLKSVMPRATNSKDSQHLPYNARANALINDQVKLLGLQAPTRVQITPDQEYLDEFIGKVQRAAGLDPDIVEEADIFDAEIIDSEVEPDAQEGRTTD